VNSLIFQLQFSLPAGGVTATRNRLGSP
jgi:hypothetical protein